MGSITERPKKGGGRSYLAQIRIVRSGKTVHRENQTFERRQAAAAWLERRETELAAPGGLERAKASDPTLEMVINRYLEESEREIGKTKAQVLRTIKTYPIAQKPISAIRSADVVEMLRGIEAKPQTRGNYLSHLSSIFALARPAWGYAADHDVATDAAAAAKRLGLISRSQRRDRRPTIDELDRLLTHYTDRQYRRPGMVPMLRIIPFAIYSTRRQEEIVRIRWADLDEAGSRILVRDMKNPGEKIGNDVWCALPPEALAIIQAMPRTDPEIFPYTTDAISASFTRTCQLLGIENLHFHDLRHEGVSRLFEMGNTIPLVANVSGHRSWSSLKRYTHLQATGDRFEGWPWLHHASTFCAEESVGT